MSGEEQGLTSAEAFDALVRQHQASVFRLARLLTQDPADAEDVLQQTFFRAWRAREQYRGEASARTWLLTITRNTALSLRSRRGYDPLAAATDADPDTITDLGVRAGWGAVSPEDLAIRAEQRHDLRTAFARLDSSAREILTLRDFEGLSGEDTAALLGLSLPAMKSRLHRARLALAAQLQKESPHATR